MEEGNISPESTHVENYMYGGAEQKSFPLPIWNGLGAHMQIYAGIYLAYATLSVTITAFHIQITRLHSNKLFRASYE